MYVSHPQWLPPQLTDGPELGFQSGFWVLVAYSKNNFFAADSCGFRGLGCGSEARMSFMLMPPGCPPLSNRSSAQARGQRGSSHRPRWKVRRPSTLHRIFPAASRQNQRGPRSPLGQHGELSSADRTRSRHRRASSQPAVACALGSSRGQRAGRRD